MLAEVADLAADDRAVPVFAVRDAEEPVLLPFAFDAAALPGAAVGLAALLVLFGLALFGEDAVVFFEGAVAVFEEAADVRDVGVVAFLVAVLFVAESARSVAALFLRGAAATGAATTLLDDFLVSFLLLTVATAALFFDALAGFDVVFALAPPFLGEAADDAERFVEADFAGDLDAEVVRVRS